MSCYEMHVLHIYKLSKRYLFTFLRKLKMKPKSLHQRVYEYCNLQWNHGKKSIAAHFIQENMPKSTIYDIIQRWEKGLPQERKKRSGRKPHIMTKRNIKRLDELINNQSGVSTRKLAKKFKCDHSYRVLQKFCYTR